MWINCSNQPAYRLHRTISLQVTLLTLGWLLRCCVTRFVAVIGSMFRVGVRVVFLCLLTPEMKRLEKGSGLILTFELWIHFWLCRATCPHVYVGIFTNIVCSMWFGFSSTCKHIFRSLKPEDLGKFFSGWRFSSLLFACVQFLACPFCLTTSYVCDICLCNFISSNCG